MARQQTRPKQGASKRGTGPKGARPNARQTPRWPWIAGAAVVLVGVVVAVILIGGASFQSGSAGRASTASWTNISGDTLASEMQHKDFTLLNVKTPYIGEIQGTDLYIPYDQLAARASELPADRAAKIVVYCRSGNESAVASQTLLNLGYTNIQNLDGGMNAWTASGRQLVNLGRT